MPAKEQPRRDDRKKLPPVGVPRQLQVEEPLRADLDDGAVAQQQDEFVAETALRVDDDRLRTRKAPFILAEVVAVVHSDDDDAAGADRFPAQHAHPGAAHEFKRLVYSVVVVVVAGNGIDLSLIHI